MKVWLLSIVCAAMFAINPSAQSALKTPATPEPSDIAGPGGTASPAGTAQGVLIETSSDLGSGIGAELMGDYREAVTLLTRAIEEEHDAMKLALARRFRGLSYKHLGRRDEALRDFLEVIRLQPQLDLGYYNAGVIYNLQGH